MKVKDLKKYLESVDDDFDVKYIDKYYHEGDYCSYSDREALTTRELEIDTNAQILIIG